MQGVIIQLWWFWEFSNSLLMIEQAFYSVQTENGKQILYYSCYDKNYRAPLYVVSTLDRNTAGGSAQDRPSSDKWFTKVVDENGKMEDLGNGEVFRYPSDDERIMRNGKPGPEYDRGHMATRSDFSKNPETSLATSHVVNLIPQHWKLNE